ncbi:UPF0489 protein C5orf22 homolog [Gigantopelta aegis]|uniref:UPF0489 protein C5orf22 homolog n=1 Tax=Gigantopelta aegis TaxID=1735272 RepID=UPI001B88CF36|nr:UPF0489 protein C5orf22 homolog [Gigantopelta aegis]
MIKMTKQTYKNTKYIQAFIVEDHNEVVPYIHTYIGSKQLPFEGLTLIHFDSHPDLLIPLNMPADTVFNKHTLYETLSIENWIMPLVYAGHISTIYWLKPPWCEQIGEHTLEFYVGKCVETGRIRTTCKENYFVSEALYSPEEQLENKKKVALTVICVRPEPWLATDRHSASVSHQSVDQHVHISKCSEHSDINCGQNNVDCEKDNISRESELKDDQRNPNSLSEDDIYSLSPPEKKVKQDSISDLNSLRKKTILPPSVCERFVSISEMLQGKRYILDIDLDFFSTKNPFQELYTTEQLRLLSELYRYSKPEDSSSEAIQRFVERREKQLETLKNAFATLSKDINAEVSNLDGKSVSLVKELISNLVSSSSDVDFDLVHDAGCTMDDTELPHHVSSKKQILQLMEATREILKLLPHPTLVTAARSSSDDYCPPDQVEFIQQNVIQILEQTYPTIVIMPSYVQNIDINEPTPASNKTS